MDTATLPPVTAEPSPLTLAQYMQRLQTVFETADTRTEAAESQFDQARQAATNFEEEREALETFLAALTQAGSDAVAAIEALRAPAAIDQDVRSFLEATAEILRVTEETLPLLADATSSRDVERIIDGLEETLAPPEEQANEACRNLQRTADNERIGVDLGCGE